MADLDAGVFCCWPVLEQRLEPESHEGATFYLAATLNAFQHFSARVPSLPGRSRKQQNFMCIKGFSLHQEGDIRHLFVVQEVGV